VLSSCESAKGSNKKAFGDIASMLSKIGMPAVVAMQYSVIEDVSIQFALNFYKEITSEKSVDLALKIARIEMKNSPKSNGFDFATPVMYLSDYDCIQLKNVKPEPLEFEDKSVMLSDLQIMKTGFVARKKELRILEKSFMSDEKHAVIIHGFGGMGKTVLATRFALKMNKYFDVVFGMKCSTTTRPEDILTKINNFLMAKGISYLNQILVQQIPIEQKIPLIVKIFNQFRALIILDNFEDCLNKDLKDIKNLELKSFLQYLLKNTVTNTKFILTSRYDFDPLDGSFSGYIEHISLPELQFPQTNWLMNNYKELANFSIRKKKQIYNVIGGHPWAIAQFVKIASTKDFNSLMMELEPLRKELIELTLMNKSFSKLDENAKKLLLYTSIYEEAVPVEALSWIIGNIEDENTSVGEPLQKLIKWGLIYKEQKYDQTVYMEHTIVRNFAHDKLKEGGVDKNKLFIRTAKYYEKMATQSKDIWDYLRARNYYFKAKDWEKAHEIVENISDYLILLGHIELTINLLQESINTTSGDTKVNAECVLATIFHRLGDLNSALKIYSDVKCKYEDRENYVWLAIVLHQLGNVHLDQGNYGKAIEMYNKSLKISEELGNKGLISISMNHLGIIYHNQGNYEKSLEMYNHSLKLKEEIGEKEDIGVTLHNLGRIHQDQGNYEKALEMYSKSLENKEEYGNKSGIAITLHQLGIIHFNQGNYDEAFEFNNQSLKIKEYLGDKSGIACSLGQLGNIHYTQGNYEKAMQMFNKSLKISEELGEKREIARTLGNLGIVHYSLGNYEKAVEMYNQSLKINEEMGNESGIANTLHHLGMIYQHQRNYGKAVETYNQSLKIKEYLGDKRGIACSLGQLGTVHEEREEYEIALRAYSTAFEIFEKLKSPYREMVRKDIERLKGKMGEIKGKKKNKWWKIF